MTVTSLAQDLRYGVRTLSRTPGFSAIAAAVLALGIGANVTVFTLANAFFLRPLPVAGADDLVRVCSNRYSATGLRSFVEYRDRNTTLAGLVGFQLRSFGVRIDRDAEHTFGEIVSGDYFSMLGVAPARGRLLSSPDDRPGAAPVAVFSHAYWTRRFGAAPDAIGRTIALNNQPFTIVGVAAERFTGVITPLRGDLWVPLAADALLRPALDADARADTLPLHLMGRLRPGLDLTRAQADLDAIGRQLRQAAGQRDTGPAVSVYPGTTLHPDISTPVAAFTSVLMIVVSLVLLIVCVNVANLVLARAAGRSVELAIRQSVGAGRGRLIRQLLTESLLLAIAGAAGGLAIAYWATQLVQTVSLPAPVPLALDLGIDIRVVAFTTIAAIVATLAFGVAPALSASKVDLVTALKTLQIGMLAGRDFTYRDDGQAPQVAIVNETLARRFWPGTSAIGQRLRPLGVSDARQTLEVVGVVRDSRYVTVAEDPRPFVYRPLAQRYTPRITLLVRAAGAPGSALPAIIDAVRTQDAGVAVFNVATLSDATALSLLPARIAGSLLGALGMLALLLAALGIYGVLSFIVRLRTQEIGVRIAIGATPREVAGLVARQAMTWTVWGIAIGLGLAVALTRFLEGFLHRISPTDPLTFATVALLLTAVAGVAAFVPARRASRLDPLVALRTW